MSMNMKYFLVSAPAVVAACGGFPPNSSNRISIELASGSPYGVAVDSTSVYWTNMGGGPAGALGKNAVMKLPIDGGTPVTLAASQNNPCGIVVDSTNVYWTNRGNDWTNAVNGTVGNGTVMRVSLDGGTAVTIASGQNDPRRMVADLNSIYWVNSGDGAANGDAAVMKVPLSGGTPIMLASPPYSALGPRESYGIAVDATSVYWASYIQQGTVATGAVMKVTPK